MLLAVGARRLRVREAGADRAGTPLMLVHGAGASSLVWLGVLRRLGRRRRVVAVDLPGHGRSEGPPCETLGECVEAVRGLAGALGLARFALVGHSLGGAIALALAADPPGTLMGGHPPHPASVATLALVATGARLPVDEAFVALLDARPRRAVERLAARGFSPRADAESARRFAAGLLDTPPAVTRADFAICRDVDLRARLPEVRCPTLVIAGADDLLVAPSASEELARGIAGARLCVVRDAGHMPFVEAEEEFCAVLGGFLEEAA